MGEQKENCQAGKQVQKKYQQELTRYQKQLERLAKSNVKMSEGRHGRP
jgi:hypothetical protein